MYLVPAIAAVFQKVNENLVTLYPGVQCNSRHSSLMDIYLLDKTMNR